MFAYNDITNAARERGTCRHRRPDGQQGPRCGDPGAGLGLKNSQVRYLSDERPVRTCPSPYELGCVAKVAVSYDWQPITPLIGNILGPITVTTDTTLPIERIYP